MGRTETTGRRYRWLAAAGLPIAVIAVLPRPAFSGSANAVLGVSLNIIAGCAVSGASTQPTGIPGVNVRCDNAVPYQIKTYSAVILDTGSGGFNITVVY